MIRRSVLPTARAASTNSLFFRDRNDARTSRATGIQLRTPMTATIMMKIPTSGPNRRATSSRKRKMITSSSGRIGSDRKMSVTRISGLSALRK